MGVLVGALTGGTSGAGGHPTDQYTAGGLAAQEINQALQPYFKQLEKLMPGYANSVAGTAQPFNATQAQLYQQYAPQLNQTAQGLSSSNVASNADTVANLLASPQFTSANAALNPSYGATASNIQAMMAAQNPNALSGSEQAQIERGLNALNYNTGNANTTNGLNTINNAATFGSGLAQKQANFANLANSATNTMGNLNGGMTGTTAVFNTPGSAGGANNATVNSLFPGITPAAGLTNNLTNTAGNFGSQIGNAFNTAQGGQYQEQIGNSNRMAQSTMQGASDDASVAGSASGAASKCCWILTYGNGGSLPWFVRNARDYAYARQPAVARGYTRMASWLVPLMMLSGGIDKLVKALIVEPLTEHAGYIHGVRGCRSRSSYQRFWFKVWSMLGDK